jgi:hypothetical protein
MSIGFLELAIVALMSLVGVAIPTVTLVVVILICRKLSSIEETLNWRE